MLDNKTTSIMRKELWSYFASPTALVFLGTYLLISLFTFFWVEKFFSRNIADLRPLFDWMPVLMIFLISTLTMRMWSDERRMGTLEFLLTLPVKTHQLVIGKFLACMGLVTIALLLTLGLAVSVGQLGEVDWGPVIGAYLASILLASAYTSIGLYISSRTESQIISLIMTMVICSCFYILGSDLLVNFFSNSGGEALKLFGTGSRFAAISRGVLDLRDIYFYLSLTAIFLTLNVYSLDKLKWSNEGNENKHMGTQAFLYLLIANFIAGNFWLNNVKSTRADMTANKTYSISPATMQVVERLSEPLLIRGYFSARTHPLLAPLVPTIRDLLTEYQIRSDGRIKAEFLDPRENEEIEAEANRKYNIEPVPFQISDRHSASMVNSYFNVVVQYGDQFEVLGFNNLIEVKHDGMGEIDVQLRNLEYDITRSILKVMKGFNQADNIFADIDKKLKFVAYISEDSLPEQLKPLAADVKKSVENYKNKSQDKLEVLYLDPSKNKALADNIASNFGFKPQALSIFSQDTFYFYLTIQDGEKVYPIGIPENLSVSSFNNDFDATLKRMVPGFLRTLGVYSPPAPMANPMMMQFGGAPRGGKQFRNLEQKLAETYNVTKVDMKSGVIGNDVDILLLLAPKDLNEKEVFAVDQFLMKGGTVVLASSPVGIEKSRNGFKSEEYNSGLSDWLSHHGITIPKKLVLDENNSGFPAVRNRVIAGGVTVREPFMAPYPFFIDIRSTGLNKENTITSGLGQLTLNWASPVVINSENNKNRKVTELAKSSNKSWVSNNTSIEINRSLYPKYGVEIPSKQEPSLVAAMVEGEFSSFFKDKKSPLIETQKETDNKEDTSKQEEGKKEEEKKAIVTSVIEKSPNISRIIVFASNEFLADDTIQISNMVGGTQYQKPLELVQNTLDWSTQDRTLLSIRSRSHFARTLVPLTDDNKRNWELINYALAILGLFLVYGIFRLKRQQINLQHQKMNLV